MSSLTNVVYAVLHVGLVAALITGIVLVGQGKVVPRYARELRKMQEANHFADGLTVKRCTHSSVPWPVITFDGSLVAWLCEECMEQRDTFRCPPRKAKPIVIDRAPFMPHVHEWYEIRTLDGWIIHRTCHCGAHYSTTAEMELFLIDDSNPKWTYEARPAPWQVHGW